MNTMNTANTKFFVGAPSFAGTFSLNQDFFLPPKSLDCAAHTFYRTLSIRGILSIPGKYAPPPRPCLAIAVIKTCVRHNPGGITHRLS